MMDIKNLIFLLKHKVKKVVIQNNDFKSVLIMLFYLLELDTYLSKYNIKNMKHVGNFDQNSKRVFIILIFDKYINIYVLYYISMHSSVNLAIHLSIHSSINLHMNSSISIHISLHPFIQLSTSVTLSHYLFINLSINLLHIDSFIHLSI